MPGITGIISLALGDKKKSLQERMTARMCREPFHTEGALSVPEANMEAGWIGLPGAAPVWNAAHNVCLLFCGEHFGETSESGQRGALLRAYEKLGPDFFPRLNGIFSGVIADLRSKQILLFNDRFGLGRIYWHQADDGFYFASEAKSLLAVRPELKRLDPRSFAEYLACGCPLQDRALFAGVSLLPGGSLWTFAADGSVKKENYFDRRSWEQQPPLALEDYYQRLKETFHRVTPHYWNGGEKVALSLTGGLDSRMVIAEAPRGALPCYTFGGMYREPADVKVGRRVAKICGQPHQVLPIGKEFFPQFSALADRAVFCSDAAMDVTGAVELFANRRAREIAPVRLTGNYGSEILRRNVCFRPSCATLAGFASDLGPAFGHAGATYAEERRGPLASFIAFKQVPWHHYARLAVEQSQLTVRSPFLDNELVAASYHAPADFPTNKDLSLRLIAERQPALAGTPTDRGPLTKPALISDKSWHWMQEFFPRAEYVYDYGMPHWLAKADRTLSPLHLDRLFLGRQKFYHFRAWYRHELAPQIKAILLDERTLSRPWLDRAQVERMTLDHCNGAANHTLALHKLLTVESLHRQLIDA